MSSDDFTTFWTARLNEDAARANAMQHSTVPGEPYYSCAASRTEPYGDLEWGEDACDCSLAGRKARALREVAAKAVILVAHGSDPIGKFGNIEKPRCLVCLTDRDGYEELWEADPWPCRTARAIVTVWNDHPDYRQEWAPSPPQHP